MAKDSGAPNHGVEINSASTCTSPIIRLIIDLPSSHRNRKYNTHEKDRETLKARNLKNERFTIFLFFFNGVKVNFACHIGEGDNVIIMMSDETV